MVIQTLTFPSFFLQAQTDTVPDRKEILRCLRWLNKRAFIDCVHIRVVLRAIVPVIFGKRVLTTTSPVLVCLVESFF